MVVSKTHPDTLESNHRSIDISPQQLHELRVADGSIKRVNHLYKSLSHLANWELEFILTGRLPKEKLTLETYFSGSNRIQSNNYLKTL